LDAGFAGTGGLSAAGAAASAAGALGADACLVDVAASACAPRGDDEERNRYHQPPPSNAATNTNQSIDGRRRRGCTGVPDRVVTTGSAGFATLASDGAGAEILGGASRTRCADSPTLGTPGAANVPSLRPNNLRVLFSSGFFWSLGASDRSDGVLMGRGRRSMVTSDATAWTAGIRRRI
jgi:hypothetical protein